MVQQYGLDSSGSEYDSSGSVKGKKFLDSPLTP
jgi:hypothetical protein